MPLEEINISSSSTKKFLSVHGKTSSITPKEHIVSATAPRFQPSTMINQTAIDIKTANIVVRTSHPKPTNAPNNSHFFQSPFCQTWTKKQI